MCVCVCSGLIGAELIQHSSDLIQTLNALVFTPQIYFAMKGLSGSNVGVWGEVFYKCQPYFLCVIITENIGSTGKVILTCVLCVCVFFLWFLNRLYHEL